MTGKQGRYKKIQESTRKEPTVQERKLLRDELEYSWHVNKGRVAFNGSTYDMIEENCVHNTDEGWKVKLKYEDNDATFYASEVLDSLIKRSTNRRTRRKYILGEEVE